MKKKHHTVYVLFQLLDPGQHLKHYRPVSVSTRIAKLFPPCSWLRTFQTLNNSLYHHLLALSKLF